MDLEATPLSPQPWGVLREVPKNKGPAGWQHRGCSVLSQVYLQLWSCKAGSPDGRCQLKGGWLGSCVKHVGNVSLSPFVLSYKGVRQ